MSVNKVTQNVTTTNTNHYGNVVGNSNQSTEQTKTNDVAVTVELSQAGCSQAKLYLGNRTDSASDEALREQLKNEAKVARQDGGKYGNAVDPFDNPFQLTSVTYSFREGSLEDTINKYLDGKAFNSSLVAGELGKMLQGTFHNAHATVEERAVNRETAIRNAESIANVYFDDENEAKAFMDVIRKAAEDDVWREKGYLVVNVPDIRALRPHENPIDTEDSRMYNLFALKNYGMTPDKMTPEMFKEMDAAFLTAFQKDKGKSLGAELNKPFDDNEKAVASKIESAIKQISDISVNESLLRLLKAFTKSDATFLFSDNPSENENGLSSLLGSVVEAKK